VARARKPRCKGVENVCCSALAARTHVQSATKARSSTVRNTSPASVALGVGRWRLILPDDDEDDDVYDDEEDTTEEATDASSPLRPPPPLPKAPPTPAPGRHLLGPLPLGLGIRCAVPGALRLVRLTGPRTTTCNGREHTRTQRIQHATSTQHMSHNTAQARACRTGMEHARSTLHQAPALSGQRGAREGAVEKRTTSKKPKWFRVCAWS